MHNTRAKWQGRCKQVGGRFCKLWGKLTRDPVREFHGEEIIIAGKLEEYYAAGQAAARDRRRQSRFGNLMDRQRTFHVVA